MHIEKIRDYCLAKRFTEEGFPFDETVLVFKVLDKIFLLTGLNRETLAVNLKCDPERAIELREEYGDVKPGFHMSKKHWNTVECEGELSDKFIFSLIDHSYDMVVKSLPKYKQEMINE